MLQEEARPLLLRGNEPWHREKVLEGLGNGLDLTTACKQARIAPEDYREKYIEPVTSWVQDNGSILPPELRLPHRPGRQEGERRDTGYDVSDDLRKAITVCAIDTLTRDVTIVSQKVGEVGGWLRRCLEVKILKAGTKVFRYYERPLKHLPRTILFQRQKADNIKYGSYRNYVRYEARRHCQTNAAAYQHIGYGVEDVESVIWECFWLNKGTNKEAVRNYLGAFLRDKTAAKLKRNITFISLPFGEELDRFHGQRISDGHHRTMPEYQDLDEETWAEDNRDHP